MLQKYLEWKTVKDVLPYVRRQNDECILYFIKYTTVDIDYHFSINQK